ncbi:hypothetical protein AMTRI_Chr01g113800 [Amborella trichopoda]
MAPWPPPRAASSVAALLIFLSLLLFSGAFASPETDALLKLKASLGNPSSLANWEPAKAPPCTNGTANWYGILCQTDTVDGIRLEGLGLMGNIDVEALLSVPNLRSISFMNNSFSGEFPELGRLGALKAIFLAGNKFSGEIAPNTFSGMGSLKKLVLSDNELSGQIPKSLTSVPKLLELMLNGNQFTGEIPDFQQTSLEKFDVSNNDLVGQIPARLKSFGPSSFTGNEGLCGLPLKTLCNGSTPSSSPRKPSTTKIIVIVIAIIIALAVIAIAFFYLRRRSKSVASHRNLSTAPNKVASFAEDRAELSSYKKKPARELEQSKLVFVSDDIRTFELQDLLKASAEVLGSGSLGSSYKAVLHGGPALVVKRFREMNNAGKEEFDEHMKRMGTLRHPNLLPVLAYYYRKEEKLLVTELCPNGSLAYLLHGDRSPSRVPLEWPTRLKIIKGVARGLAFLYQELPDFILPHGHLKSSNVLLSLSNEPLLSDYALGPLINQPCASQSMVAYKSPEFIQLHRTTKKSDVWTLGILILEILTGKFPAQALRQGKGGTDLPTWVNSVVREEWTGEVFDGDIGGYKSGEGEMLKLLQIGLGCCEIEVDKRWDMREAFMRIEELKEREADEREYEGEIFSSFDSEREGHLSSRGHPDSDFSFSVNA